MKIKNRTKTALTLRCLFYLILIITINSCNENNETIEPIISDLSISSSKSVITWLDYTELTDEIENALNYSYSVAIENRTEKRLDFNVDTTKVIATIDFKKEYQNTYLDTNPLNNSVTITLIKDGISPNLTSVTLIADGPGDTYSLITSVLAPGHSPIEAPDCNHSEFGEHIDEFFDSELNKNVFRFYIHTSPDNDRCIKFDRQRNEIKAYDKSPDNLLGIQQEKVEYKWKFKLDSGFQSSPNFTHLHQLKSVGGALASMPMYTLTTRKGNPDKFELRYAETDSQITLSETSLDPFINVWVEVTEIIKYGTLGTYEIEIKNVSDGSVLFEYANDSIINWRPEATFVRPKWGIYRSLLNEQDLRNEEVLFADFSITEME